MSEVVARYLSAVEYQKQAEEETPTSLRLVEFYNDFKQDLLGTIQSFWTTFIGDLWGEYRKKCRDVLLKQVTEAFTEPEADELFQSAESQISTHAFALEPRTSANNASVESVGLLGELFAEYDAKLKVESKSVSDTCFKEHGGETHPRHPR